MTRFDSASPPFERIALYDLQSYLERTGWHRLAQKNPKWHIFRLGNDGSPQSIELVLPAAESYSDARSRISQAVASLAQIEDRSIVDICADLLSTNADSILIRLRVPDSASSLPIAAAPRHVRAIKNLLLYSGCSELQALPHFEQPIPAAQEFLNDFEFCHTFRGSFGFEISSAVSKVQQTQDLFDPPANRKIVQRIARGLLLLERATREKDPARLVEGYEFGLNARMCDALADIGLGGALSFDVGISWAKSLAPDLDIVHFFPQFIGDAETSMLKFVSERLKVIEPQLENIAGRVVNLHCATNPEEGHARRTVIVKVEHQIHGPIEVRMALASKYYLMAIDAHSQGKELLATGQLQRKGNTWTLDAIASMALKSV